jgi:hypothetical protein
VFDATHDFVCPAGMLSLVMSILAADMCVASKALATIPKSTERFIIKKPPVIGLLKNFSFAIKNASSKLGQR